MTATVDDIGAALVTELESMLTAYGVNVYRGWPRWGEPNFISPSCSLLLSGLQLSGRVGRNERAWVWRLILLGENEQQIWEMADILAAWFAGADGNAKRLSVSGGDARIAYAESDRYQSITGNPDEEGLQFVFTTVTQ